VFTGIITEVGWIRSTANGGAQIEIETPAVSPFFDGGSVACSGVCLTVTDHGAGWFLADVSAETLGCTTITEWKKGTPVNLERPLKVGDELGGHMVLGHVDGVGVIARCSADGDSVRLTIDAPAGLMRFIAAKGSIAVDGISLTVNEVGAAQFGVNIIPHTQQVTTVTDAKVGTCVNLEVDPIARYALRTVEVG